MSRTTDYGPTLLIPAAWALTLAVHAGVVGRHAVLVALWVMSSLLGAFALAARGAMTGPVLPLWRAVILGGVVVTLAGAVDFALGPPDPFAPAVVAAWMVLPGVAYLLTARRVAASTYRRVYLAGSVLSLGGAAGFALGVAGVSGDAAVTAGIAAVGVGQTAGIVAAAAQNATLDG